MIDKLPPLHPGEVLREEFLVPLGLSAGDLAEKCGASPALIEQIANEEVGITADMAQRLSEAFGASVEFWLNLQASYDERTARG